MGRGHSDEYYYRESKRPRAEVLQQAEALKGQPLRVVVENGITMEVEVTKSDGGLFKPYAIISQQMFDAEVGNLQKGTPF